jgi:hypothetical protein
LANIASQFADTGSSYFFERSDMLAATIYAKIIISELYVEDEFKTIKPIGTSIAGFCLTFVEDVGGVAGGQKVGSGELRQLTREVHPPRDLV